MRALALTLLMMVSTALYAQVTVSGVVTETTGDPVIGCTVREKGTTTGTITDIDGNYSIRVSSANATLLFTYVGMEDQEVKIAGRKTVNVEMKSDDELLEEVVVVGYGTMKKSDLAGASVTMDESKMKGSIITSLDQSLQGRAAGVQATQTSGAPGSSSSIRVRGTATINANAEPLYVIDGVIVQSQGSSGASYGLGDALGNDIVQVVVPQRLLEAFFAGGVDPFADDAQHVRDLAYAAAGCNECPVFFYGRPERHGRDTLAHHADMCGRRAAASAHDLYA
jgi:hypothetical protein